MNNSNPALRHLGLRHVALNVTDVPRALHFYRDLLGFSVIWEPDPENVYLSSGCDNLALHRVDQIERPGALDHLGILVQRADEVQPAENALRAAGVPIFQATRTHRDQSVSCYVADPDGNSVQILFEPTLSKIAIPESPQCP